MLSPAFPSQHVPQRVLPNGLLSIHSFEKQNLFLNRRCQQRKVKELRQPSWREPDAARQTAARGVFTAFQSLLPFVGERELKGHQRRPARRYARSTWDT